MLRTWELFFPGEPADLRPVPILGAGSSFPGSQGPRPSVAAPTKTGQRRGAGASPMRILLQVSWHQRARASFGSSRARSHIACQTAMRKLSAETCTNTMFGTSYAASFVCVQLLQACILLSHNDSSGKILKSYSRHCVLACINVFPHLPIVLPNLREHRRRAGRYFAGGHTACGAEAAAGAFWLRGPAL